MPIHVKKNNLAALALLLPLQIALAQDKPAPAPPAATPSPASNLNTPPPPNTTKSSDNETEVDTTASSALDYLFNHKPGEGTTAKAGADVASALADKIKAVDVLQTPGLDDPQGRIRFETYLSLKEVPDDRIKDYFGKMDQVSEILKTGDVFTAWKMLYTLGDYKDLDAGISRELAHRIETFWNTDRTKGGLEIANDQLRSNIETYDHNADLIADDLHQEALEEGQKVGGGKSSSSSSSSSGSQSSSSSTNSPLTNPNADPTEAEASLMPTMSGSLQGKMQLTAEYLKLLEARAKIKLNEMKENRMSDQDRMDFADYIRTLYDSHRYYHVIIASDFYRTLFSEGDYPADLANQAAAASGQTARTSAQSAAKVKKDMGINYNGPLGAINALSNNDTSNPTAQNQPLSIADEVTSALEINNAVDQAIQVFKYKADKGDIASAAEQLQEAFIGNEYHPGLQGLARADKEKVGDFLAKIDVLKNQLEVRDFEQVEAQIDSIKKVAADFDSTKPMALVNGIKLESQLRLGKARLLAQGGLLTQAMQEFQTAAEEWPGNPDLRTSASGFFNTEDLQNQSTTEFDRLVQDQNYRAIFDKQIAFAPAIKGDATREQQLKDALLKVQKAEMAAQKANMLAINGDPDGAWETIELAVKDWPDDMKLNKLLADLSGHSADFVSALNKARDAEDKQELGYSLTWYVNAQGYYPASVIANEGIDRVSKQILSPPAASPPAGEGTN
jgi:hypothetical protein